MKKMISLLLVLLLALSAAGCASSASATTASTESATRFDRYNQSYFCGDITFDRTFYTTGNDAELWSTDNIVSCYLQIGTNTVPVTVDSVSFSEKVLYNTYRCGYLVLTGTLVESSGAATLIVLFAGEEESRSYDLGQMSVIDASDTEYTAISSFACGGIVAINDDDRIENYGIIMHCYVEEEITITQVGFGLESIGVDASRCQVYTPEEYGDTIMDAIDNNTLDEYVENAYQIHTVDSVDITAEITLEPGEYYLYLPMVELEDNDQTIDIATLCVQYTNQSGESKNFVVGGCHFFGGFTQPADVLEAWFAEE